MNDKMKSFIELSQVDLNQAMNLMNYIPGGREAILKFARPGANQEHRKFFLNAAKTETDPKILHTIGIRDLPNHIRFAVMDNPNTLLKTIETMASQTNNNAVQDRAKKRLAELKANPESPKGDMMESDSPYLNKILKIMDDGSVKSAIQALNLSIGFGLEDELLKKIPSSLPFSVKLGKSTSGATLTKLAGNPSTPKEVLYKLYEEALAGLNGSPIYATDVKLPGDSWVFEGILFNIAHNKSTPKELLIELAKYNEELSTVSEGHAASVRYHVAINDNPPKEALEILANDQEEDIREIARKKLGGDVMQESKFKLSTEDIKKIIREELKKL